MNPGHDQDPALLDAPADSPTHDEARADDPGMHSLDLLYGRPGFLLRRAHQLSVAIFETACRDLPLTPPQFAVLAVLGTGQPLDQNAVARATGMDKVNVSLLLRGLQQRGLVDRRQTEGNRRRMTLTMTDAGRRMMAAAAKPADAAYHRLMEPFSEAERRVFVELLQRLVRELEPTARAPLQPLGVDRL